MIGGQTLSQRSHPSTSGIVEIEVEVGEVVIVGKRVSEREATKGADVVVVEVKRGDAEGRGEVEERGETFGFFISKTVLGQTQGEWVG